MRLGCCWAAGACPSACAPEQATDPVHAAIYCEVPAARQLPLHGQGFDLTLPRMHPRPAPLKCPTAPLTACSARALSTTTASEAAPRRSSVS